MTNLNSHPQSVPEDEENDLFFFESDHLAFKGNKVYSELLKTIFTLEAQRARALKDYDTVLEMKKQALEDPLALVQKLKNGEKLDVPDMQVIVDVPEVNWGNYDVKVPDVALKFFNEERNAAEKSKTEVTEKMRIDDLDGSENLLDTHNKPWTVEEQRRLEELLTVFPPEPVELRRFKKIAAALGNRTTKQVTSRVQKYFLKLYKAGLPIPGRIPKAADKNRRSLHKHQRHNHYLFKPTTFFPALNIPVAMDETESIPGPSRACRKPTETATQNYLLPQTSAYLNRNETCSNPDDIKLEILQRVKFDKQKQSLQEPMQHIGYICDYCNEEPILGTRWHCDTCQHNSIDFCSDCLISQMYSEKCHPLTHRLLSISRDKSSSNSSIDSSSEDESMLYSNCTSSKQNSDTSESEGELPESNVTIKTEVVTKDEPIDWSGEEFTVKEEPAEIENSYQMTEEIYTELDSSEQMKPLDELEQLDSNEVQPDRFLCLDGSLSQECSSLNLGDGKGYMLLPGNYFIYNSEELTQSDEERFLNDKQNGYV